jgi:hypothetical protein
VTQFRFGGETVPAFFDNPLTGLYYQYNSFAMKQAGFIADMVKRMKFRSLVPDFTKAVRDGRGAAFLADLGAGERGELVRYAVNASAFVSVLGLMGASYGQVIGKSGLPTFYDGAQDILDGLASGDTEKVKRGIVNVSIPPALQPLVRKGLEGLPDYLPARKLFAAEQRDLIAGLMGGEDTVIIRDAKGRVKETIDRDEAFRRFTFGSARTKESAERQRGFDEINRLRFQADERSEDEYRLASTILEDLRRAGPDESDAVFEAYVASGELTDAVLEKLNDLLDDEERGVGQFERSLRSLPVAERAIYISESLDRMKTEDERRDFLEAMIEARVLTEAVLDEMEAAP